jgi:hypothetical protein
MRLALRDEDNLFDDDMGVVLRRRHRVVRLRSPTAKMWTQVATDQ